MVNKWVLAAAGAIVLAAATSPASAGSWLQQYGKVGDCLDGWGSSWAEWAVPVTGGAVCTREVDDPSQPVPAAAAPVTAYAWVRLGTVTLIPLQNGAGSLPLNLCATNPSGLYTGSPLGIRTDNPSVTVTWYPDTRFYVLRNTANATVVAVVEVQCQVR